MNAGADSSDAALSTVRGAARAGGCACQGERIESGSLRCTSDAHRYPISNFIPRFVSSTNYADNFGMQWNKFRRTQLDSYQGHPPHQRCLLSPRAHFARNAKVSLAHRSQEYCCARSNPMTAFRARSSGERMSVSIALAISSGFSGSK